MWTDLEGPESPHGPPALKHGPMWRNGAGCAKQASHPAGGGWQRVFGRRTHGRRRTRGRADERTSGHHDDGMRYASPILRRAVVRDAPHPKEDTMHRTLASALLPLSLVAA